MSFSSRCASHYCFKKFYGFLLFTQRQHLCRICTPTLYSLASKSTFVDPSDELDPVPPPVLESDYAEQENNSSLQSSIEEDTTVNFEIYERESFGAADSRTGQLQALGVTEKALALAGSFCSDPPAHVEALLYNLPLQLVRPAQSRNPEVTYSLLLQRMRGPEGALAALQDRVTPLTISEALDEASRPWRFVVPPTVSTPDLMSAATLISERLLQPDDPFTAFPTFPQPGYYADIIEQLANRNLRHEEVLKGCAWRIAKFPYETALSIKNFTGPGGHGLAPVSITTLEDMHPLLRNDLASATATAFLRIHEKGIDQVDQQLNLLTLTRCTELTRYMLPPHLAKCLTGLRMWNRLSFSLADVVHGAPNHNGTALLDNNTTVPGPQVNLIDFLLDGVEKQLLRTSTLITSGDVVEILEGISSAGVRRSEVVYMLAETVSCLDFSPLQVANLLKHTAHLQERIVDLVARGSLAPSSLLNPLRSPVEEAIAMCQPLFAVAAQKLNAQGGFESLVSTAPQTILALRAMCEANAAVFHSVPALWNSIRDLPVSNNILLRLAMRPRHDSGVSGRLPHALVTVPLHGAGRVIKPLSHTERYIPPRFRYREAAAMEKYLRGTPMAKKRQGRAQKKVKFGIKRFKATQRFKLRMQRGGNL